MANLNLTTVIGDPTLLGVEDHYKNVSLPRQENGAILANGVQIASTMMCRHCNAHFIVQAGSGIQRGWCNYCGGPTCGKAECESQCRPFESWLEAVERKATRDYRLGV